MKILIYGNRKQDDVLYDISTPEKEEAAFRAVFKTLDEKWHVYSEIGRESVVCEACQKGYHRGCEDVKDCACTEPNCPRNQKKQPFEIELRQRWIALYRQAKTGDFKAMKRLMQDRSERNHEYEELRYANVKDASAAS